MTEQDKQRIKRDALNYAEGWGGSNVRSYIAGATRENERMAELLKEERNKGMEIAIKRLENEIEGWLFVYPNPQPQSPASYGIDSLNQAIRNIRELDMKSK